jgi:hypothetical protein
MERLEYLVEQYQQVQQKMQDLYSEICKQQDGHIYLSCLRCYGSLTWDDHVNQFTVQQLCDEYYGDNGIVDVYTTNPDHSIRTYGDVTVMSLEEIQNIAKEDNVSMGNAVINWIARTL